MEPFVDRVAEVEFVFQVLSLLAKNYLKVAFSEPGVEILNDLGSLSNTPVRNSDNLQLFLL